MECKVFLRWYLARSSRVLIETLWNVKEDTDVTMPVVLPRINRNIVECKVISLMFALGNCQSINRNIVECKDGFQNWSKSRCQVLIETLWNVKSGVWDNKILRSVVLIETLWNVKVIKAQMFPCFPVCINRNIVECKETTKGLGNRAEFRY